jgi:hypothetical protein
MVETLIKTYCLDIRLEGSGSFHIRHGSIPILNHCSLIPVASGIGESISSTTNQLVWW